MSQQRHVERMKAVVQHIEENLLSEINVTILAKIACYSEFHFHRIFRAFLGESVYHFKKRLLLEKAANLLQFSTQSITDISYMCGYDTPSAFNKAFKSYFLSTPSDVRQQQVFIKFKHNYLEFKMTTPLTPQIKNIENIDVISARAIGSYAESAPQAWGKIMKFAYSNRLMQKDIRSIGISHDNPNITEPDNLRYDACLDLTANIDYEPELMKQTIQGGKYAVFLHKGTYDNFPQTYHFIFHHWLPETHYQLGDDRVCFEIYLNRDPRRTKPENLKTEIYIPIQEI